MAAERKNAAVLAVLLALSPMGSAQGAEVVGVFQLPPTPVSLLNPHLGPKDVEQAVALGWPVTDYPGLGSGLFYLGGNRFVGLTDRGPNGDCPKDKGGLFFPLPSFAPVIATWSLDPATSTLRLEGALPLKAPDGRFLSGLPAREDQLQAFQDAQCTRPLPKDPGGVDPEDVAVLPRGQGYLVVEENLPALLYVDAKGIVRMGYVPKGVKLAAPYPIRDLLPGVLALRRENRGLENLALSGDGKAAWIVLQSPIGSTQDHGFRDSLVARVLRLDVSDPTNARVTGMYLVPFSDPSSYPKANRPRDMKFSAAAWVSEERILLLERADGGARIILVDFAQATNLLDHPQGDSPELDKAGVDYARLGIRLPETRLLLETWRHPQFDTDKLEGLSLLEDRQTLAIVDDNDFAITGKARSTKLWLVRLPSPLP